MEVNECPGDWAIDIDASARHMGLVIAVMQRGVDALTPSQREEWESLSHSSWSGLRGKSWEHGAPVPSSRVEDEDRRIISAVPTSVFAAVWSRAVHGHERWAIPASMRFRLVEGESDEVCLPEYGQTVRMLNYMAAIGTSNYSGELDWTDVGLQAINSFAERLGADVGDCDERDGSLPVSVGWSEQMAPHVTNWTDDMKARRVLCYSPGAELSTEPKSWHPLSRCGLLFWRCRLGGLIV